MRSYHHCSRRLYTHACGAELSRLSGLKKKELVKLEGISDGGRRIGKKLKGGNGGRGMGLIIHFVKILKQYKNSKIN